MLLCVCMCLSSQLDASPFSTSTDSMLKPCAMGLLSLHSSRRAETDALEHVALFGNLQNRDSTEPQREKNRLAYQYMLSLFLDGWLITYKGETTPRVCIPVTMCFVLDYEEVRRSGLIKSRATQYPIFRVTGPLLGCDDVPKTLLELCLVHYFTQCIRSS